MGTSDNYVPQTENLEHLESAIRELQSVSLQSTLLKSKVVTSVDRLIRSLNGDRGTEYNDTIEGTEKFLGRYEMSCINADEFKNKSELEQLQDQNRRLEDVLVSKIAYNKEAEKLNGEYEDSINQLIQMVREKQQTHQMEEFTLIKEISQQLDELKRKESEAYIKLVENENIVHKLTRTITDFYALLEQNKWNEEYGEKLRSQLRFYEARLANKEDSYRLTRPDIVDSLFR